MIRAYLWANLFIETLLIWIVSSPFNHSSRLHNTRLILLNLLLSCYVMSKSTDCKDTLLGLLLLSQECSVLLSSKPCLLN